MSGSILNVVFFLFCAHFAADYSLQGDTMALQKSRFTDNGLAKAVPWYYWMLAHSCIHGAFVAIITGVPALGLIEIGLHFLTDDFKCRKLIGIHTDQLLHIAAKALYVFYLFGVHH